MTLSSEALRRNIALLTLVAVGCAGASRTPRESDRHAGAAPRSPDARAVVTTIRLPLAGTGVAVSPDGGSVYVAGPRGVTVVDAASGTVADTIAVDGTPHTIVFTPDGRRAYVADFLSRAVFVLDPRARRVAARIAVGGPERPHRPPSLAISRDGRRVYLGDGANDELVAIDTASGTVLKETFLDLHPTGIGVSPDGGRVYVVGCAYACTEGTLLTVDANTGEVLARAAVAGTPTALALAPDGTRAFVVHGRDATLSSVDLASGRARTVSVPAEPRDVVLDPSGMVACVVSVAAAELAIVDTRTLAVVTTVPVDDRPRAVALAPDGRFAYVTHASETLSVIDVPRALGARGGP